MPVVAWTSCPGTAFRGTVPLAVVPHGSPGQQSDYMAMSGLGSRCQSRPRSSHLDAPPFHIHMQTLATLT